MRRLILTLLALALMAISDPAAPASADRTVEKQAMRQLILQRMGRELGPVMVCIATRESNLNPSAVNWNDQHRNGPGSFGLFQIGRIHLAPPSPGNRAGVAWQLGYRSWRQLLNPAANVRVALRLWREAGYRPWGGGC